MKVLWVCNIMLPTIARQLGVSYSSREGWLSGLLERVVQEQGWNRIELGIAFPADEEMGNFHRLLQLGENTTCHCYGFLENLDAPEIYDDGLEKRFGEILEEFKPDILHVFGTEFPHTLACIKTYGRPERTLVAIQGVCSAIAEEYMADLPSKVQRQVTLRDRIRHDSIRQQQKKFKKRGENEKKALLLTGNVAGRTDFDITQAQKMNPEAKYYYLNETLRGIFYHDRWKRTTCRPYSIFLSQGDYPLKGFHYLLRAMPRVLEQFPDAHVYVAGNNIIESGTLQDRLKLSAYGKYLRKLIKENHLDDKITMLGKLTAEEMKEQYLQSHLFVLPSALENSPNSLGEAMLLGVPCVAADVGGVHNLLTDGGDGMLYPAGDVEALADRIIEIFTKEAIVERFSDNARKHARVNHDADQNYYRLIHIYREILS
ncbi:MAG: glycosyltransferase family 4 protein [Lachnospiraceae bacterium]|nr:glycosyltransferase family 4 protein [Lachnospiraceae bacterium]